MAAQPTRSYLAVAAAIIVAGVLISVSVFAAIGANSTTTRTSSTTVTKTIPESCTASATLHCVVFQQLGACSPEFWGVPWSVTIGNSTEVQPPGTPLPISNYGLEGTSNENFSVIVFSLSDGRYNFSVSPSQSFFTPTAGSVVVNGTDVLVQIAYTGTSCTGTVSTTTSSPGTSVIIPLGTAYQVQSSYDCVAGYVVQPFNVTVASILQGAINATKPGVTLYVATLQDAGTTTMGHPAAWIYSSGLTNSTNFSVPLAPGSYVFWTEGADLGCGATIVTPLEQETTVTVTEAVALVAT
jgi:hypothetical protein